MTVHVRPALTSALAGAALLVLAGCHSGGPSASPGTKTHPTESSATASSVATASSASTVSSGGAATAGAVVATKPVDVCALMPLAKARSLTGEPFVKAYDEVEKVPVPNYACDYQEAGTNLPVATIIVIPGNGANWYDRPASDPLSKPYPGLGDKAVYNPDPELYTKVTLDAIFGSTDLEFDDFKDRNATNDMAAAVIRATAAKLQLNH